MYIILGIVMLLRGFADALMMRAQQAIAFGGSEGYPAAAPLRPDLHRPRRDHDLLRGDAAGHGPDELRRAAADRRARRRLPVPQQLQLLDDGRRRRAGDDCRCSSASSPAPAGWPIRRCRASPTVPTSASTTTSGRCRSPASARLLSGINLIATIVKMRAPGMTHDEDAGVHLDRALHQHPDRRRLPGADRRARAAVARPLRRHQLLHERPRRQRR